MTLAADQRSGEWIHATAARLKRLYTALVYDVMDEMGMPNQCLDLAIKPLDRRMRVAGPRSPSSRPRPADRRGVPAGPQGWRTSASSRRCTTGASRS